MMRFDVWLLLEMTEMSHEDHNGFPPVTTEAGPGSPDDPSKAWPEFEGYKIVQELPRGGQALVYKAIHISTKMKVALKVLPPGMLASAKARRRFEQEVDLAASLNHPYIVSIRDSGIAQGQYYFAMEYISGQSLDRYVVINSLPLRETLLLFRKTCDAVAHAHQHGVIHRDLKPSNILVDERGDPHVLDFGLAKGAGQRSSGPDGISVPSMTGEIKGTLAYMSPEQAGGHPELIDIRTDVYSLGIVFYRIVTGEFPYDVSGTTIATVRHIESTEPKRPKEISRKFNPEIEAILLKCLAKEPSRRYHSAAELGEDIQRWLEGMPIIAKSVSSIYLLRKVIGRHRYTATVVSLLLIIMIGFSGVGLYLLRRGEAAERESQYAGQQLESMALGWGRAAAQVVFLRFLDAWQRGDAIQARQMAYAVRIAGAKKEELGIAFLCDPNALETKQSDLRQNLSPGAEWFSDLVIAEGYLKQGRLKLAKDAYRRSYHSAGTSVTDTALGNTFGDNLLRSFVAGRLYELGGVGRQSAPSDKMEGTER